MFRPTPSSGSTPTQAPPLHPHRLRAKPHPSPTPRKHRPQGRSTKYLPRPALSPALAPPTPAPSSRLELPAQAPSSPAPGPEAPGISAPGPLSSDSGAPGAQRPSCAQAPPPRPAVAPGGGVAWVGVSALAQAHWRTGRGFPGAGSPPPRGESDEFLPNCLSLPAGDSLRGLLGGCELIRISLFNLYE